MKKYYVTLVRDLCGYALEVWAESDIAVREYMVENYGNKVWCSVYDADHYGQEWLDKFKIEIIGRPVILESQMEAPIVIHGILF